MSGRLARVPAGRAWSLLLAVVATGLAAAPGTANADGEQLTSIAAQVLRAPRPVTLADGRTHLAYELRLANSSHSSVTLESLEVRSAEGAVLAKLSGTALADRVSIDGGRTGLVLESGWGGTVVMDAVVPRGKKAPSTLVHRFAVTVRAPDSSPPRRLSFTGVRTAVVRRPPIVVAPPLRGPRWVAASGCCVFNEHRGAVLPIDGSFYAAQRFAIDFVQLTSDNRMFSGPVGDDASYRYFGARVHAVARGRVVRIQKGLPPQTPGQFPASTTALTAGGNFIVVRIAPGQYAFYGHLQSQSIEVRVGDAVARGQVIALLGNSGHSTGPHLHFQVMDGPSPLASNGLPYEFTSFTGQGVMTDESLLTSGNPLPVDTRALAGRHRNELPLTDQILSFY